MEAELCGALAQSYTLNQTTSHLASALQLLQGRGVKLGGFTADADDSAWLVAVSDSPRGVLVEVAFTGLGAVDATDPGIIVSLLDGSVGEGEPTYEAYEEWRSSKGIYWYSDATTRGLTTQEMVVAIAKEFLAGRH